MLSELHSGHHALEYCRGAARQQVLRFAPIWEKTEGELQRLHKYNENQACLRIAEQKGNVDY